MRAYFTRRAQGAAVAAGALSLAALADLHSSNPALYDRLTGRALPLVVLAGVCGLAVLALLTAGRTKGIRVIAALGVAAVIWGWGVAQYPVLLPGTAVTLTNAGATQATFVALVVVAIAAVILVVPSFALLYTLQGRRMLGGGEQGTPPARRPRRDTGLPSAAHPGPPSPNRVLALPPGRGAGLVAIAAIARRGRRADLLAGPPAQVNPTTHPTSRRPGWHITRARRSMPGTQRIAGLAPVRARPLVVGGILTGIGAAVATAGVAVAERTWSPPPGPGSRSWIHRPAS